MSCAYCKKKAFYNYVGRTAMVCKDHKYDGMIIVKGTCIHDKCNRNAYFNIPTDVRPIYCMSHKLPDMIHVSSVKYEFKLPDMFDPTEKLNELKPDLSSESKKKCFKDKERPLELKNTCYKDGCEKIPKFNAPHKQGGMYCDEHKKMFMINVVDRPCRTPFCTTRALQKYDDHCLFCFVHLFPHSPLTRNYKTKEASVVEFVKRTFPQYTWITDKRVQDGCSRRRPDLLLDLGDQVLIIEVDENKHADYECSCENKRIMELSQDVGHRPIVFIRFNPDSYVVKDQKVPSCWCLNDNGLCVLKDKPEWKRRLDALKQQMEYWIQERTPKTIEVVQLFY